MKAHKFTGQLGGSADLGKAQPILTRFALTFVSAGKVAGGWHGYNDLTHMLSS